MHDSHIELELEVSERPLAARSQCTALPLMRSAEVKQVRRQSRVRGYDSLGVPSDSGYDSDGDSATVKFPEF